MDRKKKKCIFCGDEFIQRRSDCIICTKKECKVERIRNIRRNHYLNNREELINLVKSKSKKTQKKKMCKICGDKFIPKRQDAPVCSNKDCKKQYKKNWHKNYYSEHDDIIIQRSTRYYFDNVRKTPNERKCKICGNIFKPNNLTRQICFNPNCKTIRFANYVFKNKQRKLSLKGGKN